MIERARDDDDTVPGGRDLPPERLPRPPDLDDDDKDALVQVLNEPDPSLCAAVFELRTVDSWIVVGVAQGLVVRCRSGVHEQMPHEDGLEDVDLGAIVDLEDIGLLVPRLAAPSPWLLARRC